jgi:hypothetical protein
MDGGPPIVIQTPSKAKIAVYLWSCQLEMILTACSMAKVFIPFFLIDVTLVDHIFTWKRGYALPTVTWAVNYLSSHGRRSSDYIAPISNEFGSLYKE